MGFSADLKDYKPKSPDEEAIVSLLNKWKETWESRNIQGFLDLWHDDAKIMLYPTRIATKEEAKPFLPNQMAAFCCGHKFETPEIDVSGKEANVEIWIVITEGMHNQYNWFYWLNLVKENNRWSIMSWKYR